MSPSKCSDRGSAEKPRRTTVIELDEARLRRRRDRLIAIRRVLAETAAQQRSHGLDEAEETYALQLAVEDSIHSEFPQTYWESFAGWVEAEARAEHPAGVLMPECAICRAIAAASNVNLLPPAA